MNDARARGEFKEALAALLDEMERATSHAGADTYAGAGETSVLEHGTRRFFLDGLLLALGWSLGPMGNVSEEARVKADTTTFIDYAGVHPDVRTPLLIVEAKAWDKPFVSARDSVVRDAAELLMLAIEHIKAGRDRKDSPVLLEWHDHLIQIAGYVRNLRETYQHDVPRVVLTSGQWTLIFVAPAKTFLSSDPVDEKQFVIIHKSEYVKSSTEIFDLLALVALAGDTQATLRPFQLNAYLDVASLAGVFHGVHVHYEQSGSSRFAPRPRILIYPVLLMHRNDGAIFTVMEEAFLALDERSDSTSIHLDEVDAAAKALLKTCAEVMNAELEAASLATFPGFPMKPRRRTVKVQEPILVHELDEPGEWTLVTGKETHFLRAAPLIGACRFHEWAECRGVARAAGSSAIAVRSVKGPRSFFTDGQPHHCAHQAVLDLREERCRIAAIDVRTCCQACLYADVCWSEQELTTLPCGS